MVPPLPPPAHVPDADEVALPDALTYSDDNPVLIFEILWRDQCDRIYRFVPKHVHEIDSFFYD